MKTIVCTLFVFFSLSGCRTLSEEAACERDRDCPEKVPFCGAERDDAGVGNCVAEEPPPGIVDAGPFVFDRPDVEETDASQE